ncbi:MAG: hypothetical protein JRJ87_07870 [Deltaproteobacteria bacterium]|nr:hypothetical protein [Deltaproteobacteria bacterium]
MNSITPVSATAEQAALSKTNDAALMAFCAKASVAFDLASECLQLFNEDGACQRRINLQGVKIQRRNIRAARKKRMELLKKKWEASRKSGFWAKLGKIFSGITVALTVLCPVGACVGLSGTLIAGACKTSASVHRRTAALASADLYKTEHQKQRAQEMNNELLRSIESAAGLEKNMLSRIRKLAESESRTVSFG